MARTTKSDLEKKVKEQEETIKHLYDILNEDNQRYSELVEQKTSEFHKLPEYQQMKKDIEQLEEIKRANEHTIERKKKIESALKNKIQELLAENEQLKSTQNKAMIHNARHAGRKPMSEEKLSFLDSLLRQGKKEKEICKLMNISRATFYRVKKQFN